MNAFFKIFLSALLLVFVSISVSISTSQSCTTFFLHHDGRSVFGKNYDWPMERGLVLINKRGLAKTAMPEPGRVDGPWARWVSRYGSVTFNQYGREFPMGGMNETGLVIHMMALHKTAFPVPDERPVIKALQWIQYHLDSFETVDQVIAHQSEIRILFNEKPGLHYLVADRKGNSAAIEFLNGKLVVHKNDQMPVKAMTNSPYADAVAYLKAGLKVPLSGGSSLVRFETVANRLADFKTNPTDAMVNYSFDILDAASTPNYTKWSIVYDIDRLIVYFKTLSYKKIKKIEFKAFGLSCAGPVKMLNIRMDADGCVNRLFLPYSKDTNYLLIRHAFKGTEFLNDMPDFYLQQRAVHPDSHTCQE